jgi:hypothetical protein
MPGDDTSDDPFRDDDPQSDGSDGTVYDLDAPGIGTSIPSTIVRMRQNFLEYAVLGSATNATPVGGSNLNWFATSSCRLGPGSTAIFVNDPSIPGDNQSGTGSTKLTYNLQ